MSSKLLAVTGVLVAAILVPGASTAGGTQSAALSTTTIRVKAKNFAFVLSRKRVPHGRVRFVIDNVSSAAHDLAIAGHKSKIVQPGKSTIFTVTLRRGRWPYRCTVDSHAKLGMKGVLVVT